jgi:hypothetical protein
MTKSGVTRQDLEKREGSTQVPTLKPKAKARSRGWEVVVVVPAPPDPELE